MPILRIATWVLSAVLHAGLFASFVTLTGAPAFDAGSGDAMLRIEQGIALDDISMLGDSPEHIETIDIVPVQRTEEEPVEKLEEPEIDEVITSTTGEKQEIVAREMEPEKPKEPKPKEIKAQEQPAQVAMLEEQSVGAEKVGGAATLYTAYLGKLRSVIEQKKVNPRTRLSGTVVVRFTVDASGQVTSREVTSSSGSRALDEAAVASVDRASPFPPVPSGLSRSPLIVSVPFKYSVR